MVHGRADVEIEKLGEVHLLLHGQGRFVPVLGVGGTVAEGPEHHAEEHAGKAGKEENEGGAVVRVDISLKPFLVAGAGGLAGARFVFDGVVEAEDFLEEVDAEVEGEFDEADE